MKLRCIFRIFNARVKIRPTAKPPGMRCPKHAGIHVHCWAMRILHMRHKRNARRPKPWIVAHAGDPFARGHCLLRPRAQCTENCRDIDPNFLKHPATAHHTHQPATGIRAIFSRALRWGDGECTAGRIYLMLRFYRFKTRNNIVTQLAEPCACSGFFGIKCLCHGSLQCSDVLTASTRLRPPSTVNISPVTKDELSEAKNCTASATSVGPAMRPCGVAAKIASR